MACCSRSKPTTAWSRRRTGVRALRRSTRSASPCSRDAEEQTMSDKVALREVGMRDGLQSLPPVLTTEQKNAWCKAEFEAGVREIEVTSFVPAKLLPMFADAEEVVREALTLEGLRVSALIPNLRGAERGVALGVHEVAHVLSVSEGHNQN